MTAATLAQRYAQVLSASWRARAELTPAQRAAAIKRRKQIWEALHPEQSGASCATNPAGRGSVQFAASTTCNSCLYPQVTGLHPGEVDRYQVDALAMNSPGAAVARNSDHSLSTQAPNFFPAPFSHFQIHF